jgi:hypothetical protein
MARIEIRDVVVRGQTFLEISTASPALLPHFYAFALSVADRIQVGGEPPMLAIRDSLAQWRDLFRQVATLSDEEQTGLLGELWVLDRLFGSLGSDALEAWTGPRGEAHDFRLGVREFEVKATRTERRIHWITSTTQLVPSPGRELFVLSVQFAAAGAGPGVSIRDRVRGLEALLEPQGRIPEFEALLQTRYGLSLDDAEHYGDLVQFRSEPRLIPVTDELPCIRAEDILAIERPEMERVTDVLYRLDVAGLGYPDGSAEFLEVLPEAAS